MYPVDFLRFLGIKKNRMSYFWREGCEDSDILRAKIASKIASYDKRVPYRC